MLCNSRKWHRGKYIEMSGLSLATQSWFYFPPTEQMPAARPAEPRLMWTSDPGSLWQFWVAIWPTPAYAAQIPWDGLQLLGSGSLFSAAGAPCHPAAAGCFLRSWLLGPFQEGNEYCLGSPADPSTPHGRRNFYKELGALVWNLPQEQHWGNLPWKLGLTSLASSTEQPDVISLHAERVCMQGIQFRGQWPRNGSSDSRSFYHPQNFTPIGSNPSLLENSDRLKCQAAVLDGLTFFSKSSKRSRCYHYSTTLQACFGWVRCPFSKSESGQNERKPVN